MLNLDKCSFNLFFSLLRILSPHSLFFTTVIEIIFCSVDESVQNFKALLEVETRVPLQQQQQLFNGKEMRNSEKLSVLGVNDGDLVMMVSGALSSSSQLRIWNLSSKDFPYNAEVLTTEGNLRNFAATGEIVTVVGDHNPALLRYFDCTRSGPRSAFEGNVVYQCEIMEYIHHPVLITECACNPNQSRCRMAELLFESYRVPSIAFGVDAAFSYKYNQQLGRCNSDGLAICSGFMSSHAIPFINGEPVYEACCRTNVGGYHVTDDLKQLLSLKYLHHSSKLIWEKVEDLKMEHCYIAPDYASEVRIFQGTRKKKKRPGAGSFLGTLHLLKNSSEVEIAREAALKERQGQRLREIAEAKRSSRINELENEIRGLEFLLKQLPQVQENNIPTFLRETGYPSKQEIESTLAKAIQSLHKAKGEQIENEEKMDSSTSEKYNLLNVPDEMLTPEQYSDVSWIANFPNVDEKVPLPHPRAPPAPCCALHSLHT